MSDPIINKAAEQLADKAAQQGAAQPAEQAVDAVDQARFEAALGNTTSGADSITVDAATMDGVVDGAHAAERTMGDAVLEGMQKMKASYDQHVDKIEQTLIDTDGQELTVQETMRIQMEVMQMGLQQDLTAKVADKTSQGVQTLFKNQ